MTFETAFRDVLYALRTLRKNPVFACIAVVTLALGIGANTAIFSVVDAVLLKPLNYPDAGRLVNISVGATPDRFQEMKTATRSFTGVGAFAGQEDVTLITGGQPRVLHAARVSADFLRILGTVPLLGVGFTADKDLPGAPNVLMISAELWQQSFSGDTHIVGKTLRLATGPSTIVGVMPAAFQFPFPGLDVWLTRPEEWSAMPAKSRAMSPFLTLFARLKPGITTERANAEVAVIQHRYAASHAALFDAKPKEPVHVSPLQDQLVADIRTALWILFGAVGFVLLIACANVASLLLARAHARSRELALRSALGASRGRLVAQLLTESVLLSLTGGVIGLAVAAFSLRAIRGIDALELPRSGEVHVDWIVLAFGLGISFVTGLLFGLIPSLGVSRPDLIAALRTKGDVASGPPTQRIRLGLTPRGVLVTAQVALSIVLLIGAALLIQSVARLRGDNPGFNAANLLTMRISLPLSRYDTDQKKRAFFQELFDRVQPLPGIKGLAAAMTLPMTGYAGTPVQDASKPVLKLNERLIATVNVVTPAYFQTLQIPLKRGRDFIERDKQDTQRVAIIDENLARYLWPSYPRGIDPIGQFLLVGGTSPLPARVVGIAGNVHQNVENTSWPESVYLDFGQSPLPSAMLALRTAGDPLSFTSTLRRQVKEIDRDQPVSDIQTMEGLVEAQLGERRLLVTLLGTFSAVALTLALVGIYGVIAYSVTQRTYEMGIRRALGARDFDILWLIVAQALGLALTGTVIGIAAAYGLTRVMKTLLFHVSTTDPATFGAIALVFLLVALAASYIPARRATRMDPMAAFRYE